MFALTVALVVTTVLSLSFSSTRRVALVTIAALSALFPVPAVVLTLLGLVAAAFIHLRKGKSK